MLSPFNSVIRKPFSKVEPIIGNITQSTSKKATTKNPNNNLARVLNFYADYSGCGHWRMIWPENILKINQTFNITGGTVMISDSAYFADVSAIRIQRQATENQKSFLGFLKQIQEKQDTKMNIIYEIDDIIFIEDIPHYNKFRTAFDDPKIRETSKEIMLLADEMTVTNQFMKDYFADKTGHTSITVVPNLVPRFWMDRFYDKAVISNNLEKNKRKPRILYCGSGAHFDVDARVKHRDDFYHVNDVIRKTINDFQWVFFGGYPYLLRDLIASGKIEFHNWETLMRYPYKIAELKPQLIYAPLANNTFNKAKSDLKFIEGCCMGVPTICQDIETYSNAHFKFNTGDELIDQINNLVKDRQKYMGASKKARLYGETRWLEDNIKYYVELYKYPYGHPERKLLNKLNNIVVK
tara:strand:+ start:1668 stop:2894 length:1227 start_codon:yes stop_codon:yes gene_type:complete